MRVAVFSTRSYDEHYLLACVELKLRDIQNRQAIAVGFQIRFLQIA